MANNFKLLSKKIKDRIRLQLYGDFDGSSACELINILKDNRNNSHQIYIDTNNLATVHPFGMEVFKKSLSVLRININNITITGKHKISFEQRW
jgi:ABC-type transporter Mla MlaB component